jgi:hypothetical protein
MRRSLLILSVRMLSGESHHILLPPHTFRRLSESPAKKRSTSSRIGLLYYYLHNVVNKQRI